MHVNYGIGWRLQYIAGSDLGGSNWSPRLIDGFFLYSYQTHFCSVIFSLGGQLDSLAVLQIMAIFPFPLLRLPFYFVQ